MNEPRLYVDFNEMIEDDLVLLSQTDSKVDSSGTLTNLYEGKFVKIYMDDENPQNQKDNLIAEGFVERNTNNDYAVCKWNCRITQEGIRHESEIKKTS